MNDELLLKHTPILTVENIPMGWFTPHPVIQVHDILLESEHLIPQPQPTQVDDGERREFGPPRSPILGHGDETPGVGGMKKRAGVQGEFLEVRT